MHSGQLMHLGCRLPAGTDPVPQFNHNVFVGPHASLVGRCHKFAFIATYYLFDGHLSCVSKDLRLVPIVLSRAWVCIYLTLCHFLGVSFLRT